jgi:ATP-dependent exoDNAse (exonuclease V) beta subunit
MREYSILAADQFESIVRTLGYDLKREDLRLKSLYEICEDLIRIYTLNDLDPYLLSLLDHVLKFNLKQNKSIGAFLSWWEENKHKLSIDGSGKKNAVKIMSIHKSKGLEFPVVICPFMNWMQGTQKDDIWSVSRNNEVDGLPVFLLPAEKKLEETEYSDLYTREAEKSSLDDLNILYVGFTRPVDRLYIISSKPHQYGNLSKHFVSYLEHLQIYDETKLNYVFGAGTKKTKHQEKEGAAAFHLKGYVRGPWGDVVEISRESLRLMDDEQSKKITYGNLVHQVLSEIKELEDVNEKLKSLQDEGLISAGTEIDLRKKIRSLFTKTPLRTFFGADKIIKAESEILLPEGNFIRPDRVVMDKENVYVIDYKTGKKRDKDREQVDNYARIMEEMGYKNVKKYLVYIADEEMVEV